MEIKNLPNKIVPVKNKNSRQDSSICESNFESQETQDVLFGSYESLPFKPIQWLQQISITSVLIDSWIEN